MKQEQIDQLIHSLTTYAMNDIKNNRERPIAAFILGTQLLNTLSIYRYGMLDEITFFQEYMPMYDAEKLHDSLNRRLIPYYSLRYGYYTIGFGDRSKEENLQEGCIHVDDFITNTENALNKFLDELKQGVFEVGYIANKHPILQDKS